jgi:hypothetical protein
VASGISQSDEKPCDSILNATLLRVEKFEKAM